MGSTRQRLSEFGIIVAMMIGYMPFPVYSVTVN